MIWLGETHVTLRSPQLGAGFAGLEESDFRHIHQPINEEDAALGCAVPMNEPQHTVHPAKWRMKLVQYLPDGNQRIVRLLRDGDALGLETLVGPSYQHDAIALTDCEICAIPVEVINRAVMSNPACTGVLMNCWQRALSEADVWLTWFSTGPARQRVARLLLGTVCPQDSHLLLFDARTWARWWD